MHHNSLGSKYPVRIETARWQLTGSPFYGTTEHKRAQHEGQWQIVSCVPREEMIQPSLGEMQTLETGGWNSGRGPQSPMYPVVLEA